MSSKLRETLENIVHHFCTNCPNNGQDGCELSEAEGRFEFLCHKLKQARAALAEPVRNCDIGTPKEQSERFGVYCCSKCNGSNCGCREYVEDVIDKCAIKWSHMPYEKGENNAVKS